MSRKLVGVVLVLAGLVVAVVVVVVQALPSGKVTSQDGTNTLEIAMLAVPVADTEPLVNAPDQFEGVSHPSPAFETSNLGPDLSFRKDVGDLQPLDSDEVLRAVYLGHDVSGQPYYIWHNGSSNLLQMLGQIVADLGSVGRLESSYGTETTGPGLLDEATLDEQIREMGLPTGSITSQTGQPTILTAEWHGLPEEVAAVVFYQGPEHVGWQRPVSGTAALQVSYNDEDLESIGGDFRMVALTADGEEWNRFSLFSAVTFSSVGG